MHGFLLCLVVQASKYSTRGRSDKKEPTKMLLNRLEPCTVSDHKIERMKKMDFTHLDALDFDRLFSVQPQALSLMKTVIKITSQKRGKINLFQKYYLVRLILRFCVKDFLREVASALD